jgi:hypothetical protein
MEGVIWTRWTRENVVGNGVLCEDQGVRGILLLWPAELEQGFIVAIAHQVSRDRRHRKTVGGRARALFQSHKQSTSVDRFVHMFR